MSRYKWEPVAWAERNDCNLLDDGKSIGTLIGPATAQRVVDALNAQEATTANVRKHVQQELVREQAARDDGCVDGAPV